MNDFYIYCWLCKEWGDIPFYVGKGHDSRYCSLTDRGKAFTAITSRWTCYPLIVEDNLSETEAMVREDIWKRTLIFKLGYPIMDGEGCSQALKNMAIKEAKTRLRRENPCYHEGRPSKDIPLDTLRKFREKQKGHLMSTEEICSTLGISRATWYAKLKEANV